MINDIAPAVQLTVLFVGILGSVWSLALWLSTKFSTSDDKLDKKITAIAEKIIDKLEYHERHDDQRFSNLGNDLWSMRLDIAKGQRLRAPQKEDTDPRPETGA